MINVIKDLLFGKKVIVKDAVLGELSSRIKSKNPDKEYSWECDYRFKQQQEDTFIILDGDFRGPYASQLEAVHRLLNSYDEICTTIDHALEASDSAKIKALSNWKYEFYLSAILNFEVDTNEFEVNFDSISGNNSQEIYVVWKDGKIDEIDFDMDDD